MGLPSRESLKGVFLFLSGEESSVPPTLSAASANKAQNWLLDEVSEKNHYAIRIFVRRNNLFLDATAVGLF